MKYLIDIVCPNPTISQLLKVFKSIKDRWRVIADAMDVDRPTPTNNDLTDLGSVLREWLRVRGEGGATWSRLEEVLELIDEPQLMERIRDGPH